MSTASPELSEPEPRPPSDVEVCGGVAVAASTEEVALVVGVAVSPLKDWNPVGK